MGCTMGGMATGQHAVWILPSHSCCTKYPSAAAQCTLHAKAPPHFYTGHPLQWLHHEGTVRHPMPSCMQPWASLTASLLCLLGQEWEVAVREGRGNLEAPAVVATGAMNMKDELA